MGRVTGRSGQGSGRRRVGVPHHRALGSAAFAGLRARFLVRSVDTPSPPLPRDATAVLARGPFSVDDEVALMRAHGVEVVVTKDSGGPMTAAKLTATRGLGIPVVLVRRPPLPEGVPVVATVADAVVWPAENRWPRVPIPRRMPGGTGGRPVGVALRAAETRMSGRTTVMCLLCQTALPGDAVSLFTARRAGAAGRNGNTVGTYMCADPRCAQRACSDIPAWLRDRDPEEVAEERAAELGERVHGFLDAVRRV